MTRAPAAGRTGRLRSEHSLRHRLIATTLGSSIVVGIVATAVVIAVARHEANEAFDDALREGGRLALSIGERMVALGGLEEGRSTDRAVRRSKLQYQIIDDDGDVVRRSAAAPRRPFVDAAVADGRRGDGRRAEPSRGDPRRADDRFVDVRADGERWRVYVVGHRDLDFSVQIGQPSAERDELIEDAVAHLVWPLVALWALLGLGNWWAIRRLLGPLERLAATLAARTPDATEPVADEGQAREVKPLVAALNGLLARLGRALDNERRFTADAAHELRTPLAAIASRIQLMQRRPADGQTLAADLQQLRDDVARTTALVGNLLELARLDPDGASAALHREVDLPALFAELRTRCAPLAARRDVRLEFDCRVETVTAHPEALEAALQNLVDNAIRHGREGGRVQVCAWVEPADASGPRSRAEGLAATGALVIAVRDDGPGVDPAERDRLTERFYRVLGNEAGGSGLGLAIVAGVARLHRASLSFGDGLDGRGFGAVLRFPQGGPGQHGRDGHAVPRP